MSSAKSMLPAVALPPAPGAPAAPAEPAFELQGVGKRYGRREALRGVSLRVNRGECYGLAGANGAGKTTLIRILLGLAAPDAGEVRLLGARPDEPEVRRRVGYVPESAELPPTATPRQLVRRWTRLRGLPAEPARTQGLAHLERLGMASLLDRAAQRLSKGERQRTLLALALLGEPELLVLDEPTDGLDPLGRALVREVIREECAAGRTVFLNSHLLMETERICSRVGILHRGALVREERIARRGGNDDGRGTTSIALAAPVSPELLASGFLRAAPDASVLVDHAGLAQLNEAIDRLRASGAQIIEVRRVRQDLEAAFTEVAGGSGPDAGSWKLETAGAQADAGNGKPEAGSAHVDSGIPIPESKLRQPAASLLSVPLGEPAPAPAVPLRALRATARVAQEIAADLASRKLGWMVLGSALLASLGFFWGLRSDFIQGAAAGAKQFSRNGSFFSPEEFAAMLGKGVAATAYWAGLLGGVVLAALFAPPLLDPRRTVLVLAQPVSRADLATGIFAAVCTMAFLSHLFLTGLLFSGLRLLGIPVSARLLLVPLPFIVAFASIYALMLAATYLVRSGVFAGLVGFGALVGIGALAQTEAARPGVSRSPFAPLYGLVPQVQELSGEALKLGAGGHAALVPYLLTLAVTAALLLVVQVIARRSER